MHHEILQLSNTVPISSDERTRLVVVLLQVARQGWVWPTPLEEAELPQRNDEEY